MAGGTENGGSSWRRSRYRNTPMSQINVTPFVDVMLVLLIIFMVAAPLLTVGVPIDLPETNANPITGQDEPLAVSITNDGKIFVQNTEVDPDKLVPMLRQISRNNYELRIFVRGDQNVNYGSVMQVMGQINAAGFTRIALEANQQAK